jgi:hypothetical protein
MARMGSDRQPVRVRIRAYRARKPGIIVNGFLVTDSSFAGIVRAIEIYGNRNFELRTMQFAGNLVEFEVLPTKGSRVRETGLGRLSHEGWTTFSEIQQPQLQHVATVRVAKFTRRRTFSEPPAPALVSYAYANNISGWPSAGFFGTSYEGTITRRKFRSGLGDLITSSKFQASADYYYYFERNDDHLVRRRLCSITVKPKKPGVDVSRAVAAVRVALSFLYEVTLKPLRKIEVSDTEYKTVEFPQEEIDIDEREFHERPISVESQKKFTSSVIRWLYNADIDISHVEYAVGRYVAATRELPLENSFSAGCEAIESLFATLKSSRLPTSGEESDAIRHLRKELRNFGIESSKKKIANDRLGGVFVDPPWQRVHAYLMRHKNWLTETEINIIQQCDFFRYRNLSAHGRRIAADGEVSRQSFLMRLAFQILLKVTLKSRARLTLPSLVDLSPPDPSKEPHFVEIWE